VKKKYPDLVTDEKKSPMASVFEPKFHCLERFNDDFSSSQPCMPFDVSSEGGINTAEPVQKKTKKKRQAI